MPERLDHVVLAVQDLAEARRDTERLLGFAPLFEGEHPGQGSRNAWFALERSALELLAPAGPGPFGDALRVRLRAAGEGLVALALGCDDLDATRARLREAGVPLPEPAPGETRLLPGGELRRWRSVRLPEETARGGVLLLIERPPETTPRTLAAPGPDAVQHLDHVVIESPDLEASRRLYQDLLGLRLALDRSFPERGLRMLFFRVGGVTLEVVGRLGEAPDPTAPDRLGGLAWRVADVAAAHARLADQGFELSPLRRGFKPGTRVFTVRSGTHEVPTLFLGPDPAAAEALR